MNHHVFLLKLNLNSSGDQNEILQIVKNDGGLAIQTSDGLCLKSSRNKEELTRLFAEKGQDTLQLQPLDPQDPSLTPDVRAFIGLGSDEHPAS